MLTVEDVRKAIEGLPDHTPVLLSLRGSIHVCVGEVDEIATSESGNLYLKVILEDEPEDEEGDHYDDSGDRYVDNGDSFEDDDEAEDEALSIREIEAKVAMHTRHFFAGNCNNRMLIVPMQQLPSKPFPPEPIEFGQWQVDGKNV